MIAVVVCRLTKMAHFIPYTTTLTAEGCAELLKQNVFRYHGIPSELVSDRDPRFTSHFWGGLLKMLDVGSLKSTANHPQTDGQTERVNGSLINILRCYLDKEMDENRTWLSGLVEAEMVYNGSTHVKTGCSPYFLNYGCEPVLPHEDPDWVVEGETHPNPGGRNALNSVVRARQPHITCLPLVWLGGGTVDCPPSTTQCLHSYYVHHKA